MNILIVSFFTDWAFHFGVELELAEKHIRQGDSVTFLACNGSIGACMANSSEHPAVCANCRLRRHDGINQLSGDVIIHSLKAPLNQQQALEAAGLPRTPTIDDYKALRYKGHDLGWAALSSANMLYRDPLCDSAKAMQAAETFLGSAIRAYEGTRHFLVKNPNFDRAYVFNGRFAETRGAFRALQDAQIEVCTHERGASMHHYQLFPNTFPHDPVLFQERVQASWAHANNQELREEVADFFFRERKNGQPLNWTSFTEKQIPGKIPKDWDTAKRNIVIFNSSEDELASIGDFLTNPVYSSQANALKRICLDTLGSGEPIHYYLRVHPNLSNVENSSLHELLRVKSPNLTTIHADEDISTYALLEACDRVLTFGSTVGVEAAYWGKTAILAGKSYYDQLDVAYVAQSHEEVMNYLLAESLAPKNRLGALKYGYHCRTRGTRFEHWKPIHFHSGMFGHLTITNFVAPINGRGPLHRRILLLLIRRISNERSINLADKTAQLSFVAEPLYTLARHLREIWRSLRR